MLRQLYRCLLTPFSLGCSDTIDGLFDTPSGSDWTVRSNRDCTRPLLLTVDCSGW